jgi:hypothetical protein
VIHFEEIGSCFVLNVFCGYFVLLNGPNWEVIRRIPILGLFLVKIVVFNHARVTLYSVTTCHLAINCEDTLPYMYFFGYFVVSKCPNWEIICIIPIFGVIFGPNLGI